MLKKTLCLVLALLFVVSIAACGGDSGSSSKNSSDASASGGSDSMISDGGIVNESVDSAVTKDSLLANKKYGGQEFSFYYWYSINEIVNRKVNAFNDAHDAKIKVTIGTSFEEDIAKSIAGGTPYDLIANNARFIPQSIFRNLFEPLNEYIVDVDYYDSAKPQNGGLSKTINDVFTWKGKIYAAGSAKAVYSYAFYYNKKKYKEAGLEDPYELWKDGKWTWEKMLEQGREVNDVANNVCFLNMPEIHHWLALQGLTYIKRDGDSYSENLGDAKVIDALHTYQDILYGDEPFSVWGAPDLSWYSYITFTDAYTQLAGFAKRSAYFNRKVANLGVVPVPSGFTPDGMYATHEAQGYSAARGAKEPSLAACYGLWESRVRDTDVGSEFQMPSEIRNAIDDAFAANGYCPQSGFADSSGELVENIVNWYMGRDKLVIAREDVTAVLNEYRPLLDGIIKSTLNSAKNFG